MSANPISSTTAPPARDMPSQTFEQDALVAKPPQLSAARVRDLVWKHYGIETRELTSLGSERDQNFRLQGSRGEVAVVRIANATEAREVTDLQTAAHLYLEEHAPAIPVQRIIRTLDRQASVELPATDGGSVLRLMSYLDGLPLSSWPRPTKAQCANLGAALGGFDAAMRGFSHPAGRHGLMWNILNAPKVAPLLSHIEDTATRDNAARLLQIYERLVEPDVSSLRTQIIHNDPNPHNILFDAREESRVSGVLDLGDLLHGPLIADLAVAASALPAEGDEPLAPAIEALVAFHRVYPLEELEIGCLFPMMCARQVMSLGIAAWRARLFPENRAYIFKNSERARRNIDVFAALDPVRVRDRFLALSLG